MELKKDSLANSTTKTEENLRKLEKSVTTKKTEGKTINDILTQPCRLPPPTIQPSEKAFITIF